MTKMKPSGTTLCKSLLVLTILSYFTLISLPNLRPSNYYFTPLLKKAPFLDITIKHSTIVQSTNTDDDPTNLSHFAFGLVGSEKAWHHRKAYIESWWRPNITRGTLFLDKPPSASLLPWPSTSPPYKVSDDLTKFLNKTDVTAQRIIHGIMEVFREVKDHENLRWIVMGDDDSIFFLDNMVEVLATYDHTKYYYIGAYSEFIMSNYLYSFSQGFGGAGFMLSYPLAKVMAEDMENCLRRYKHLDAADKTTMSCAADFGVSLTHLKGIHQFDLRGDISGYLSSHPNFPLMSLHHFDMLDPIFPGMDRFESTRHLMKSANADQPRLMQQTICYHKPTNWSFSVAWGYSAHIYENIIPRSVLQYPIETFKPWLRTPRPPRYMFNTREMSKDPCHAPHWFFMESVDKGDEVMIISTYNRGWPRLMPSCAATGNHSADSISQIQVLSPAIRRSEIDRSECCDVVRVQGNTAEVKLRECMAGEIIA